MFVSQAGICKKVPGISYSLLLLKAHQTVLLLGERIRIFISHKGIHLFLLFLETLQAFVHNVDGLKTRLQMSLCLDSRGEVWGE